MRYCVTYQSAQYPIHMKLDTKFSTTIFYFRTLEILNRMWPRDIFPIKRVLVLIANHSEF